MISEITEDHIDKLINHINNFNKQINDIENP